MSSQKRKLDSLDLGEKKILRKMRKPTYETSVEAKKLWNDLRDSNIDENKKSQLSGSIFNLIVGKAAALVYAHDTSRVIQTFIKVSNPEHKAIIFEELKDNIVLMTKSKFAKFTVRKFLKYGTKEQKLDVFSKIKGNVVALMRHKEANEIVEYLYNDFSNTSQRNSLEEEFYGPAYMLHKTKDTKNVVEFVSKFPDKKESVTEFMKKTLATLIEKNILQLSIIHKLLYDFFLVASITQQAEMIEALRDELPHFVHTKFGSKVAMKCIWYGNAKDRKAIVKSFKTFVVKICKEEFGHYVLLAIFDCVDDTRIVQKALLDELLKGLEEVIGDQNGRKVLFYLLSPRDPKFFHPDVVKILSEGDNNENSKKEKSLRHQELLSYVSENILDWVGKNINTLVKNDGLLLLQAVLTKAKGDPTVAMRSAAELVALPFTNSPNKSFHFVDDTSGHLTLKKIIENDIYRISLGETVLFSTILLDIVSNENLKSWIQCNRGCFIIVKLLEVNNVDITAKVREWLSGSKSVLKKSTSVGAQILLNKLNKTE